MITEEKNKDNIDKILSNVHFNKALKNNRFYDYLIQTKKYKVFFLYEINKNKTDPKKILWNKALISSIILALIITLIIYRISILNPYLVIELVKISVPVLIGGMFTILGLSLAGLAIVTSNLRKEFISTLILKNTFINLLSIIFNFYFSGFLLGISILQLLSVIIIIFIPAAFNIPLMLVLCFSTSLSVIFSTIFTITLLGTCIRLFLIRFAIEIKE